MNNTKFILCNGAANSGKDVAMSYLNKFYSLRKLECKDLLHDLTQKLFQVPSKRYWQIYNDRSLKEIPLEDFSLEIYWDDRNGFGLHEIVGYSIDKSYDEGDLRVNSKRGDHTNLSIREAMIYVSEIICKPRFGEDFFGVARAASVNEGDICYDASCGFVEELPPLISKVGQENILLLRIHRDGYTFEGDSRSYIPDGVIENTVDIYNNGTEQDYFNKVESVVKGFLNV